MTSAALTTLSSSMTLLLTSMPSEAFSLSMLGNAFNISWLPAQELLEVVAL